MSSKENKVSIVSVIVWAAANLFPIAGVVFFHWSILYILAVYLVENIIIGFYGILRIILWKPLHWYEHLSKIPYLLKFVFNYGKYTLGYMILFTLLHYFMEQQSHAANMPTPPAASDSSLAFAAAFFYIDHGLAFAKNYILSGQYKKAKPQQFITISCDRLAAVNGAVILGGFITLLFNQPVWLMIMLILVKIAFEAESQIDPAKKSSRDIWQDDDWDDDDDEENDFEDNDEDLWENDDKYSEE